jgi:hypothetical protein
VTTPTADYLAQSRAWARVRHPPSHSRVGALRRQPRRAWRELLVVACIYELYTLSRRLAVGGHGTATTNAEHLLHAERSAHLAPEQWFNHAVTTRPVLAIPADYAYASLHYAVTVAVLIWLWRSHPGSYLFARRTLTAATLLGLVGFVVFPLAPPRMLPGFVDTMARYGNDGWWGTAASAPKGLGGLTNQYAAMPSLHVGWALWCAWQIVLNTRRPSVRVAAVLYPLLTVLVVISTGNHYLADVAAGATVLLLGSVVAAGITRTSPIVRGRTNASLSAVAHPMAAAPGGLLVHAPPAAVARKRTQSHDSQSKGAQGDEQRLVGDAGHTDPGSADDRPSEGLPRPIDEREAGIADRARNIGADQDRLGAKAIEQRSRGKCYKGARAQDRSQEQTGGRRREAAELVQVDDLEREDQPIAEPAERIPGLQEQHHARQVRPPSSP